MIKKTIIFITFLCIAFHLSGQASRVKYNFNAAWKFIKANPTNAQTIDYDDTNWSTISTPHTFNDIDTFDDLSIGKHIGEKNPKSSCIFDLYR